MNKYKLVIISVFIIFNASFFSCTKNINNSYDKIPILDEITINDISGREIYKQDFNDNDSIKINSRCLNEGINFLTIRNDEKSITKKIIMY